MCQPAQPYTKERDRTMDRQELTFDQFIVDGSLTPVRVQVLDTDEVPDEREPLLIELQCEV